MHQRIRHPDLDHILFYMALYSLLFSIKIQYLIMSSKQSQYGFTFFDWHLGHLSFSSKDLEKST
jgi:hypothetical protein